MLWNWLFFRVTTYCMVGLILATPALAQEPVAAELPRELTSAEIDTFIARLDDDGVRRLLIAQLQGLADEQAAAAKAASDGLVVVLERDVVKLRVRLGEVLSARRNGPEIIATTFREVTADGVFQFFFSVVLLIAAGLAVEALFRRFTSDVRQRIDATPDNGLGGKLCSLILRSVLDFLSIAAFAVGSVGSFVLIESSVGSRRFVTTYVLLAVVVRLLSIVSRFLLSPRAPRLRLVKLSDGDATSLHRWFLWVFGVGAFSLLTLSFLNSRGITGETAIMLRGAMSIVVAVLIVVFIWRQRHPVAKFIRGGMSSDEAKTSGTAAVRLHAQLADVWHILATAYVAGIWVFNTGGLLLERNAGPARAIFSLAVFLILPAIDLVIGRLLRRAFSKKATAEDGSIRLEVEPHSVQSIAGIRRGVRVLLVLFTAAALFLVWGFDLALAAQNPIIARAAGPLFNAIVVLVLGYVVWQVLKSAINRRLEHEGGDLSVHSAEGQQEVEEGGGDPGTRLQTLLPLFRKAAIGVIAVLVVLSVLSSFGINIAPLLAGAGVIGIAVGFGAQALVQDVFSGLFFLIDDAFRVGEYIETDSGLMGTVEEISVRSMKLRHHRGALHILPFGELRSITNRTRGWVVEKLDLRLPYDTDVEQVRKIIKKIGIEMMEDPDLGPRMIDPLKSQGVYQLEDSAMILRAKFTAKPRGRAKLRREAQVRIKQAFDTEGIHFAHRQVTVHVPGDEDKHQTAGAAAAAAVQAQEEQEAAAASAKA